jgi:hypothetical protein
MTNIHLFPTHKPSRLWTNNLRRRLELDEFPEQHSTNIAKHIYITNSEEIKEGDFIIVNEGVLYFYNPHQIKTNIDIPSISILGENDKKVILTTDQDLIKDGVQAIDDEFLEWFVKNPSCEYVKINVFPKFNLNDRKNYGIIIPKEETKQETLEETADIERIAMDKLKNKWGHLYTFGYPQRPFPTNYENDLNNIKIGLYEGAKWQQERSYNEEDLREAFFSGCQSERQFKPRTACWQNFIEQFKKK